MPDANADNLPVASRHTRPPWRTMGKFAAAYLIVLCAGLALKANPWSAAAFWPRCGVLFAALMFLRRRDWAWVSLSVIALDVLASGSTSEPFPLGSAVGRAFSSALGSVIGVALVRRGNIDLLTARRALMFCIAVAIGCACSTTIGVALFSALQPAAALAVAWLHWWASNFIGIVTVAPLVVFWTRQARRAGPPRSGGSWRQFAALNAALIAVTAWIFGTAYVDMDFDSGYQFAVFPLLVVIAVQSPPRGTMLSSLALVVSTAVLTDRGLGPFASHNAPLSGILSLQLFLALAVTTTLILSAAAAEIRELLVAVTSSEGRYRREATRLRREIERRRVLQREQAAALKEREVMLQEIHHRVKNNLQIVASLINMQVRSIAETCTRLALQQCRSRVETMSQIHEMLYQSRDYARVPFARYARNLAARVLSASGISPAVTLEFELEDLALPVGKAIPCGLILNELIANSLKHAFPHAAEGRIRVQLRRLPSGEVLFSVSDDGIGIPDDYEPHRSSSLGAQLVITLVEQLDGRLEIARRPGASFTITFPLEPQT